jgi:hypothetical protein
LGLLGLVASSNRELVSPHPGHRLSEKLFLFHFLRQARSQEFVPGAPATASGMVLGLGSALAGMAYIAVGRLQEAVGLTHGILIGFSMVVPAALVALVVLLRGGGEAPVTAP